MENPNLVKRKQRSIFFLSDGTGITAEALGHSLLAQFENIDFERITLPYVDTKEKALRAVERIDSRAQTDGERPIVFDTVVNPELRAIIAQSRGYLVDIFSTLLPSIQAELGQEPSRTVGRSHAIIDSAGYLARMEAVNFAVENDDGARTRHYDSADVIITGVSRSGKTPTCLYLALQFGIRAANYPLTEEDLDDLVLPSAIKAHRDKLFGLSIDPERLCAIRTERKANSRYASLRQCTKEVHSVEALFNKEKIPFLNSTHYSIEEISTRLMDNCQLKRRIKSV